MNPTDTSKENLRRSNLLDIGKAKRRRSKRGLQDFTPRDQEKGVINIICRDSFNQRNTKELCIFTETRTA